MESSFQKKAIRPPDWQHNLPEELLIQLEFNRQKNSCIYETFSI